MSWAQVCGSCRRDIADGAAFFCYWCGQPLCAACARRLDLPLDTEATVCPGCESRPVRQEMAAADEAMMEIMVEAALAGHDLTAWSIVADGRGWQARCRRCREAAWVGESGVQYSLLADACRGAAQ